MPLLYLLAEVVECSLSNAIVHDARAIRRVIDNCLIQGFDNISSLAVDNSHLAIFELHDCAVAAKIACPEVVVLDDYRVVFIFEAHAILRCKSAARLDNRVDNITLAIGGYAMQA